MLRSVKYDADGLWIKTKHYVHVHVDKKVYSQCMFGFFTFPTYQIFVLLEMVQ